MVLNTAPDAVNTVVPIKAAEPAGNPDPTNPSVLKVTIAGCGGCGINLSRSFTTDFPTVDVLYFDTSITNARFGEQVNVLTNGNGSGSHRAENARDIQSEIANLSEEELGVNDVAVVIFSLAGGSGSVIGPLLMREFARRAGMRVICVVVFDSSSTVAAKNSLNTLKTLSSIATNANLYLPLIVVTNDQKRGRKGADEAVRESMVDLIHLLTRPVYEVDRNDRMNWIDPSKVVGASPGLKLMTLESANSADPSVILGGDSKEIVDSTLILQTDDQDEVPTRGLQTRLKKEGIFYESYRPLSGTVSGDISAINALIDSVERMQQVDSSQKYSKVDRLAVNGTDDLVL